jgi:hypothetical protein
MNGAHAETGARDSSLYGFADLDNTGIQKLTPNEIARSTMCFHHLPAGTQPEAFSASRRMLKKAIRVIPER